MGKRIWVGTKDGLEYRNLERVQRLPTGEVLALLDRNEAWEFKTEGGAIPKVSAIEGAEADKALAIGAFHLVGGKALAFDRWYRREWTAAESEPETGRARPSGKRTYRPASDSVQREFGSLYTSHRSALGRPPRALDFLADHRKRLQALGVETAADVQRVREQCRKNGHIPPWNTKRRKAGGK